MAKLFIWDFHGVLEQGNEGAVVEVTNAVLSEFGLNTRLDHETNLKLYGQKWSEYFRLLDPLANESKIKDMVHRGCEISLETDAIARHIKPSDNSHYVLNQIKQHGHENLILSNTQPETLDRFIDSVNLSEFVDYRLGTDSHRIKQTHSNPKIPLLKEFLEGKTYDQLIAIGDRPTDIEAGKSVGAITYLYAHNTPNKNINADYHIDNLKEVLHQLS
jgi:phosphoglycolate phosphatase-like HAD superfamily hydrolase